MLSIIICTYNRDKYIYNVLKSLAENDFPRDGYEIVLVNNNSKDHTEAECVRFRSDFPNVAFTYCIETNQGLSYARNRGIMESKGDILVYVDDDATVNKEYIKAYSDFFLGNPDIAAAGGPICPVYETEEPRWMSHYTRLLITGKLDFGESIRKFPKNAFPGGGNAAYRKSVFEKIGFFNVELGRKGDSLIGAEEKDIFDKMTALGLCFYYLPNAILFHIISEKKLSNEYFRNLTFSIGRSERIRTKAVSDLKYRLRILSECIKWGGTVLLWMKFAVMGKPMKGNKLLAFRWNVTKGLLKS